MEGNTTAWDILEDEMSGDCTVLNNSCLQADLQDVFLNPHLFAVTQVYQIFDVNSKPGNPDLS
jgi:hypothetical protein